MSLCLLISADTDLCIRPYDVGVKNGYNAGTSHPLDVRVKGLIKCDLIAVNTISAFFLSVEVSSIVVAFMFCIIILFL